jgi:ABC-type antimicrobial peptide transport system permease subunit
MIRHESVITALIGGALGIALGIVLGALLIARVGLHRAVAARSAS